MQKGLSLEMASAKVVSREHMELSCTIELWARDFNKNPVYWLNGLAGTGKSTIAKTIAERLFADGKLGTSSFCSRDFEDRRNLHFIFPTLTTQLMRRYPKFLPALFPLIKTNPNIAYKPIYDQMEQLIVQPLNKSSISTMIIIDALDECEDEDPASAILSVLGQLISEVLNVKFFLTSRPEPHISVGFRLLLFKKITDVSFSTRLSPTRLTVTYSCSSKASSRNLQIASSWVTGQQSSKWTNFVCRQQGCSSMLLQQSNSLKTRQETLGASWISFFSHRVLVPIRERPWILSTHQFLRKLLVMPHQSMTT